jgi:drug/metabolite transporter (DMT)-like permease
MRYPFGQARLYRGGPSSGWEDGGRQIMAAPDSAQQAAAAAAQTARRGAAYNLRGAILMILSMAAFTLEDVFLKLAFQTLPYGQILFMFGLGGALAFGVLVRASGAPLAPPGIFSPLILMRSVFEVIGRFGYTFALVLIPLSSAAAILQATPLVVVAGAAIFFGERVGWRRWMAIAAGFAGVLLILRPGTDAFEPAAIFAVIGMLGFAFRDLSTRAVPAGMSNMQLAFQGFVLLTGVGAVVLAVTGGAVMPGPAAAGAVLGSIVFGMAAYYALISAMRTGEVSVVTSFRYTRMVFALILGFFLFSETPDAPMLIGSAIIIASGLYTLWRGHRRARGGR